MRKLWVLLLFITLAVYGYGQKLNALLSYNTYCTDQLEPYIEFTFLIDGQSVKYVANENGKYQAGVKIDISLERKDTVVKKLDFLLLSDEFADSVRSEKPDFADKQNILIPNGEYFIRFSVKDTNSDAQPFVYLDHAVIAFPPERVSMADVTLLNKLMPQEDDNNVFNKYGFCMIPLFHNYVPEEIMALPIYTEIYNTEKILGYDNSFIVRSYIEHTSDRRLASPQLISEKMLKTAPVSIFLNQFNVYNLPSGNYNLVLEVMDKDSNNLLTAKTFFQRSNPRMKLNIETYNNTDVDNTFVSKITDLKTMQDYIGSLYPIANAVEQEFFVTRMKTIPLDKLQRFFYSFWLTRNPSDPEGEWEKYKAKVDYVQQAYGSKQVKGFRTDRGRVYLQYGPPNQITEAPYDPQSYPYEIWHYYNMGEQNNIRFVFYNPDLISNDYELLHSDALGEPKDMSWQLKLTKRLNIQYDPDIKKPDSYWGGSLDEDWLYGR